MFLDILQLSILAKLIWAINNDSTNFIISVQARLDDNNDYRLLTSSTMLIDILLQLSTLARFIQWQ